MLFNIDVDGLSAERNQLMDCLAQIDNILQFIGQYGKFVNSASATEQTAHNPPAPVTTVQPKGRHPVAGKRKSITVALATGPATSDELADVLKWTRQDVDVVLLSMISERICFLNEHGKLQLSESGKKQAAWFAKYPKYMCYRPSLTEGNGHATHA